MGTDNGVYCMLRGGMYITLHFQNFAGRGNKCEEAIHFRQYTFRRLLCQDHTQLRIYNAFIMICSEFLQVECPRCAFKRLVGISLKWRREFLASKITSWFGLTTEKQEMRVILPFQLPRIANMHHTNFLILMQLNIVFPDISDLQSMYIAIGINYIYSLMLLHKQGRIVSIYPKLVHNILPHRC